MKKYKNQSIKNVKKYKRQCIKNVKIFENLLQYKGVIAENYVATLLVNENTFICYFLYKILAYGFSYNAL